MQTFLPYPSFAMSAAALDWDRLNKQRSETLIIMRSLTIEDYGWKNHPAVKMWRGHEGALLRYQAAIVSDWLGRPHKSPDVCWQKTVEAFADFDHWELERYQNPPWLGDENFHASHRGNLLRKDDEHYAPLFYGMSAIDDYVWPVA